MNLKDWKANSCIFIIIGGMQFIVLTILAMFFYTGGTNVDSSSPGYNFWYNFFSDLGMTKSHSGKSNIISYVLFTIALTIVGVSIIPFLLTLASFYIRASMMQKLLSIIATIIGIISAICFIGIAFSPADLYLEAHGNFVRLAFFSILIVVLIYSFLLITDKNYPNKYAFVFVIASGFICYLVILQFLNVPYNTPTGLALRVVSQKIVVYSSIISFSIQGYGVWCLLKNEKK